ncbi:MAG: hypothetical protein VXA09_00495, partial [Burkholderiaceae bacterium]
IPRPNWSKQQAKTREHNFQVPRRFEQNSPPPPPPIQEPGSGAQRQAVILAQLLSDIKIWLKNGFSKSRLMWDKMWVKIHQRLKNSLQSIA